ncbi:MAG: polysaccharide biosynthesis tyrosine autokinase [Thiohalocapsa sp.]
MTAANQIPAPGDGTHPLRIADPRQPANLWRPPAGPSSDPPVDEDVIDLKELWHVLVRRRRTIALSITLALVLAAIATFNATPIYRSTLLMQIDREANQVVDYGSVVPDEASMVASKDFYATQYELLKSRSLSRRVIDQLGLKTFGKNDDASFLSQTKASINSFIASFSGAEESGESAPAVDPELATRRKEEEVFSENLTIEPVRNSKLVRIHYDSPSATEAAAVANSVANGFVNLNLERRFDASSYAKKFLEEQLDQMRATLEDSEKRFVAYAREREIVNMDDRLEIMLNKLREMNSQLVGTEAERIKAESEYQELLEASGGGAPDVLASTLVQSLKERRGELQAQYQDNLEVYKPGYPKMQQLQRQIEELNDEIARESASISGSVKARFEARVREEAKLRQRITEIKEDALALQDRSTDYETLRREVETNRELYDGLLQRMKEVGVAAGVGQNNVSIVDSATIPLQPYKPSLTMNLAIALALGLFGGVGFAFLLETLDDSIKTAEETERHTGAPVLSLIPRVSAEAQRLAPAELPLLVFKDPKSALAEAARSLRTSLLFSTSDGVPRVLHFASSSPGEGKTTTAISTAITFAQAGGKVLLIDADLRNPSIHRAFSLPNLTGLTNHLAGDSEPADIAQPTQITRLFAITSGPLPPNPVELLSTPKMVDLLSLSAERFDHVIIDGPPVIGLADALVLANLAKATVFVVEPGTTRTKYVDGAIKRLHQANIRILGAVLTKVGQGGPGYAYGDGYSYNYLYNYSGTGDEPRMPRQEHA